MCRDCRTCTDPGFIKSAKNWGAALLHVGTIGISWAIKRGVWRHCPTCGHLLSSHARRADGSFVD